MVLFGGRFGAQKPKLSPISFGKALPTKIKKRKIYQTRHVVIDSYPEGNYSGTFELYLGNYVKAGQAITIPKSYTLESVRFYLIKGNSPTGNATASVFACTGTPGVNGAGTGSALITSTNSVDVSTLTAIQLITFNFASFLLEANKNYVIAVEYSGGDVNNYLNAAIDNTAPTHNGNLTSYSGAWTSSSNDIIFYLNGSFEEEIEE